MIGHKTTYSGVAQQPRTKPSLRGSSMVERRPVKAFVAGSSPARGGKSWCGVNAAGIVNPLVAGLSRTQLVVVWGSSPARGVLRQAQDFYWPAIYLLWNGLYTFFFAIRKSIT